MTFLYQCWYAAAWSHEVTGTLLSRTLLDIPIVFFRGESGAVVALHDQCPHRFAPLSKGALVEGKLRCGYHGLEFDASGQCVGSCLDARFPKAARVRSFTTFEQDNLVWIWMGDAPAGDTSRILRFPFLADPNMRAVFGLQSTDVDYQLISDNLMDLTHAALLHPLFGGLAYKPKFRSRDDGDDVISEYTSEAPSSLIVGDTPVIVTDVIRWRAPSNHHLVTRIEPKDTSIAAVEFPAAHVVTPESRRRSHYFWAAAVDQNHRMTNEDLYASLSQSFDTEDKPMLEAVQRRMGERELMDMNPLLLPTDASAIKVRRKLQALIAAEAEGPASTAASKA